MKNRTVSIVLLVICVGLGAALMRQNARVYELERESAGRGRVISEIADRAPARFIESPDSGICEGLSGKGAGLLTPDDVTRVQALRAEYAAALTRSFSQPGGPLAHVVRCDRPIDHERIVEACAEDPFTAGLLFYDMAFAGCE